MELVAYAAPDDPRPAIARSSTTLGGFHPRKLGHINSLTGDLVGLTSFYCDVLGMRVTDRLGEEGTWLHLGADHHTVALVGKGYYHFHHLAFELTDWGEFRVALDHLAQHGRWLAWGPVRHALGQNLAAYVRIPEEECMVELYSDMEQLPPTTRHARGPTTPTPRTRGASSRRGRTSGSTPRPSTGSARGSRLSDTHYLRRPSDGTRFGWNR